MVFSGLFLEDIGINNLMLIHVSYWNFQKSEICKNSSYAVHMVSFVKLVSPRLSELKVTPKDWIPKKQTTFAFGQVTTISGCFFANNINIFHKI